MHDYCREIQQYFRLEAEAVQHLEIKKINEVINLLEKARESGGNIYVCGNGGSAATASHFLCDLNKGVSLHQRKKYNFICLNDNIPNLTATANDIGYSQVFRVPLEGRISKKDLFIGISGSGNSENVILAAEYARSCGALVVGMTGFDGGKLKKLADCSLHVNMPDMQITEDLHMMFVHVIMRVLSSAAKEENQGLSDEAHLCDRQGKEAASR